MTCRICGIAGKDFCDDCLTIRELVSRYDPGDLLLVVDGSYQGYNGRESACGAGLVLATAHDEAVIATCVAEFRASNSVEAEYQAIIRGLYWAPVHAVWSNCDAAITRAVSRGIPAYFLEKELRDPLHHLAHRLADIGMKRDWDRYDRIWIPTAVW